MSRDSEKDATANRARMEAYGLRSRHPLCTADGLSLFCWLLTTKEGKAELAAFSKREREAKKRRKAFRAVEGEK